MKYHPQELVALLLCLIAVLNFVSADSDVLIKCQFGLRRCPKGYRVEFHGRNMLNSECFCRRPFNQKEIDEKTAALCTQYKEACFTSGINYSWGNPGTFGCTGALRTCKRDDVKKFCQDVAAANKRWTC